MRIGFSGYFLDYPATGSGQYSINLLREMPSLLADDLVVFCPSESALSSAKALAQGRSNVQPLLVRPPIPVSSNIGKVWYEQISLPLACRKAGVDLLHVPYFGSPWWSPCPTIVTVHDVIMMVLPEHRGSPLVRVYAALAAAAARRASVVIADSECTRRDILRRLAVPEERVRVVPLAADSRFKQQCDVSSLEAIRARYGLSQHFVFYIGGLEWRKNVGTLIRAFAQAPQPWLLAIAGEAPQTASRLFPDLRAMAVEAGIAERIRFLGRVPEDDKPGLYVLAGLFVFPSRYEGFGLTVLEAMACGTPVISSNAASLPEVAGDGALLFEPGDEAGLAEKMCNVLSNEALRAELVRRGLAQAARFSWRRTAEETIAAYQLALEQAAPRSRLNKRLALKGSPGSDEANDHITDG